MIKNKYGVAFEISVCGAGGFGTVMPIYALTDKVVKCIQAIPGEDQDVFKERSSNEIKILERLKSQSNIIGLLDFKLEKSYSLLYFKKYDGSLRDLLKGNMKDLHLTFQQRQDVFFQCCVGLQQCHQLNVLHRDFNPENILFNRDENGQYSIVISDFGSSCILDQECQNENLYYTINYRPLELCYMQTMIDRDIDACDTSCCDTVILGNGEQVDEEKDLGKFIIGYGSFEISFGSDIWALACVWYEINTGKVLLSLESEEDHIDYPIKDECQHIMFVKCFLDCMYSLGAKEDIREELEDFHMVEESILEKQRTLDCENSTMINTKLQIANQMKAVLEDENISIKKMKRSFDNCIIKLKKNQSRVERRLKRIEQLTILIRNFDSYYSDIENTVSFIRHIFAGKSGNFELFKSMFHPNIKKRPDIATICKHILV
jgi:serine/threonine protein kinase